MPTHRPSLVLIAADDQAVRDALQFALRLEGFGVRTYPDSEGLLADAGLTRAACVILDDRKPHLDGFEVMARLRERELNAPVILLASYATARLRTRAATAGFRAVLEKPLLNNILLDTLRAILSPAAGDAESTRGSVSKRPEGRINHIGRQVGTESSRGSG
jgi:two-component system, LuxR family, response regulator FixJ